jgi:hypothetical protein
MSKLNLGSMIVASALLAMPVLAATPDNSAANSPANANPSATAPAPHGMPGMATTTPATPHTSAAATPADRSATAAAPADRSTAAAEHPSPPKFMTSDDQVRVGKVIGSTVYNDKDQSIGSIDDVLMSHDNKANTAVISVGGFLGMGAKLVSVPFDQLKIEKDKIVMPGATQDALKGMPEYKYNA